VAFTQILTLFTLTGYGEFVIVTDPLLANNQW